VSSADAWVGRELDGRYVVEHVLGEGGMGVVLRGKHQFTGVPVAIKVLRQELQLDPEVQARFLVEAQAPNAIGHPAIVKVLDAGRTADGLLYMAMELLVGRSLRVALATGQLSLEERRRIVLDLLTVLGHAHARGFVHRDLKPDNVFLASPNDEVRLLDFGITKALDDVKRRTVAGALLGTPAYMAPEQLADASNVDGRADLWAIGVMLYEMMTGRLPLQAATPNEMLLAVASGQVTPIRAYLPSASPALEQFFDRALARDPRRRFGAAIELAQALATLPLPTGSPRPDPAISGTRATSRASHAPVAPAPLPLAISPHHPSTTSVAPAPLGVLVPHSSSKMLLVVGAIAVVAIIAGVVIAMTSGSKPPQVAVTPSSPRPTDPQPDPVPDPPPRATPDATIGSDGPLIVLLPKDAGIKVTRDAGTPRDPGTARDARTPAIVPTQPPDAAVATCPERCNRLANRCGTRLPTCITDCETRAAEFTECFDQSMQNCTAGAACGFQKICGFRPSGSRTCSETAQCQFACSGNLQCLCACDGQMDPRLTLALAQLNACVLGAGCADTACIATHCGTQAAACR